MTARSVPRPPAPESLAAQVARIKQAAENAYQIVVNAYLAQITELEAAALRELDSVRTAVANINAKHTKPADRGEGYWDMATAEMAAKDVARYAREACHWFNSYQAATEMRTRQPFGLSWSDEPAALVKEREHMDRERSAMEMAALGVTKKVRPG